MLAASVRAEAIRSLADGTPALALSAIAQAARRITMAGRAAIVLTDPAVRQPSVVATAADAPGRPVEPLSAERLLRIDTPGVRMVEMIAGSTTIGMLVLSDLAAWGLIASGATDTVLDLADLAATAVILDRAFRWCGYTAGRIAGDVVCGPDPLKDMWWVVLNIEHWQVRASMARDREALQRLHDRVDQLVDDMHRIERTAATAR